MPEYVTAALFVYTDDTKYLIEAVQNNSSGSHITPVAFDALMQTPQEHLAGVDHEIRLQHRYHPR
jgi:hypothetical protein